MPAPRRAGAPHRSVPHRTAVTGPGDAAGPYRALPKAAAIWATWVSEVRATKA